MTYEEINEMMQEIGLPFAYHHFAEGEKLYEVLYEMEV